MSFHGSTVHEQIDKSTVSAPHRRWLTHLKSRTSVHRDGCSAVRFGPRQHSSRVAARFMGAGIVACFSFARASTPSLRSGSLLTVVHRKETLLLLGLRRLRRIIVTTSKICSTCASTASRNAPSKAHIRPPTFNYASAAA